MPFVKDVAGQGVCVLGSGDNEVSFALTGLGGCVTSVDISERRLAVAAERADVLRLHLTFVQADVTDLSALADDAFGLVYTGGHMSVWVPGNKQPVAYRRALSLRFPHPCTLHPDSLSLPGGNAGSHS
jgi:hypothetical protein